MGFTSVVTTALLISAAIGGDVIGQQPTRDVVSGRPCALRGQVRAMNSGQPLTKARIRLISAGAPPDENRQTLTDNSGHFEFGNLLPGRYTLIASKTGFVSLSYGQKRPNEQGRPIELQGGETLENVDVSLPPGGIIAGRVLDELGEPVADAQVTANQLRERHGQRTLSSAGRPAMTDDLGNFRLYSLPPGRYYVSARMAPTVSTGVIDDQHDGYGVTYYPDAASLADAAPLVINVGQTISDVTVTLVRSAMVHVSGVVFDSQGRQLNGGSISVISGDESLGLSVASGAISADGSFALSGVPTGAYRIVATSHRGPSGEYETGSLRVSVGGDDLMGVQLSTVRPSMLTGAVFLATGTVNPSLRPNMIRLSVEPVEPAHARQSVGVFRIDESGMFSLASFPGLARIVLQKAPTGWVLSSVLLNGIDVTDAGVDVKQGEALGGLEVVLTDRVTGIVGVVEDSNRNPVQDYVAVVFAQDRSKWNVGDRYVRVLNPDQDGKFSASGLPPGDYLATAVSSSDRRDVGSQDTLEQMSYGAIRFTLGVGEQKTLDVPLDKVQ